MTGVTGPRVAVMLPCFNEAASVGRCVKEANETFAVANIDGEVIVVDNGSTDGSRQHAEAVRGRHPVTIVDAPDRANASYARNVGARAAGGDVLMFVDADDELAAGYVEAMARALAETGDNLSRPVV